MAEPFIGEIRIFAGNFAPRSWAFCDGQLLAVSQNDALFSLLGTIYGGDGRTTFGLPDLRGRLPIHMGTGPGLSQRPIGGRAGAERATVAETELPPHRHVFQASSDAAADTDPTGHVPATATGTNLYGSMTPSPARLLDPNAITPVGGSQSHANVMPFLCLHFIIALTGTYPSRN